ncbi:hypothetical protein PYJP_14480 [Pyrofollis japonicus]|uniref:ribbon-helix-helix protein, CopG family n=1 Tax=Pyrofollis japonicus TaxID=3060460 RepID=UPI00295AA8AB|nr:ribbon-helix-helix protein, CopG family [Pyrofollis japonicus]BEP18096.1 hypothetical protein PYJP_14480 [Pyrofollis japonicus]
MQRIVTFKIDDSLLKALDMYAKRKGLSRSEVIRAAIESLLRKEGIKVPKHQDNVKIDPRVQVIEIVV